MSQNNIEEIMENAERISRNIKNGYKTSPLFYLILIYVAWILVSTLFNKTAGFLILSVGNLFIGSFDAIKSKANKHVTKK